MGRLNEQRNRVDALRIASNGCTHVCVVKGICVCACAVWSSRVGMGRFRKRMMRAQVGVPPYRWVFSPTHSLLPLLHCPAAQQQGVHASQTAVMARLFWRTWLMQTWCCDVWVRCMDNAVCILTIVHGCLPLCLPVLHAFTDIYTL